MKSIATYIELPTRAEVVERIQSLISGQSTREEISQWASRWMLADHTPGIACRIDDWAVWDALGSLFGADLPNIDRSYLHGQEDFSAWLKELQDAPTPAPKTKLIDPGP